VKNNLLMFLGVFLCFVITSMPLGAHHGSSAFETDKMTMVKGTVTRFAFINPHALIYIDAVGDKGDVEHWIVESNSNNHLMRGGFDKNSLKPGDQVIVTGRRAKNGTLTLDIQCHECSVTDLQGKVLLGFYS
jgi:uncharacterized protein DUF6152